LPKRQKVRMRTCEKDETESKEEKEETEVEMRTFDKEETESKDENL
jgi:hypothetical protein